MLLDSLFGELKKIMLSLEIKYRYLGEDLDTKESKYASDRYISCVEETDTFYSHTTYSVDAIKKSGLTLSDELAAEYGLNPNTIPDNYRLAILREQRKIVISEYKDENNYFRKLSGLPDVGSDGHYTTMDFYDTFLVDFKPVHEFTDIEALQLIGSGYLDQLISMFPDAEYLKFLGGRRIDPYITRKASNFQILRSNYTSDKELLDKFLTLYDQNREYVMSVLYVKDFSKSKPYYDNYMAMMVLVMTIQRISADMFKSAIARDFYDISMIKLLFDCYNVPFIEGLPIDYQKLIVKNLNKLLYYKSTDKVLFDIADILGFDNSDIYKYYLVKNHRMDNDGKPIFQYIKDENDNLVEDRDAMYELYFQTVNINESNEEFALSNTSNRLSYNSVVTDDPYWFDEDADLMETIYNSEFNYIETKYLHMNIMFKMTETVFETVHVFRLLQDKRSQTEKIAMNLPRIISDRAINLYTYTIFMCAALAKHSHLTGEIITSPSKTLYVMGFDFGNDLTTIKKALEENMQYVESNKIANYLYYTEAFSSSEVDKLFLNIKELWVFLSKCLKEAKDIESYRAYQRIYRALYVTQDVEKVLMKPDGTMPATYIELLKSIDPELAQLILDANDNTLYNYLNHGIDVIKGVVLNADHLQGLTDSTEVIVTALQKLITFFKSYTVDLREFNILYVLDHPYLNAIKIIDKLVRTDTDISINEKHVRDLLVEFSSISSEMRDIDRLNLYDMVSMKSSFRLKDTILSLMKVSINSNIVTNDKNTLIDIILSVSELREKESIEVREFISYISRMESMDRVLDEIKLYADSSVSINTKTVMYDIIGIIESSWNKNDIINLNDSNTIKSEIYTVNKLIRPEKVGSDGVIDGGDQSLILLDTTHIDSKTDESDRLKLSDNFVTTGYIYNDARFKFNEKCIFDVVTAMAERMGVIDTVGTDASLNEKCEVFIREELSINRELSE